MLNEINQAKKVLLSNRKNIIAEKSLKNIEFN